MLVWYLIASLCLVLANGQRNNNYNIKPEVSPTPDQQLLPTKEYLLYLTPSQAQSLQSKGAVIRPFYEVKDAFLQKQYQQSVEENIELQDQTISSNEKHKLDKDLNKIYKALDNQQANKDLDIQLQSTENPIEKSRPKYKLTAKQRQQEYIPRKNIKTKNPSSEYTRYFPKSETKVLKTKPYQAQPSPRYYFDDSEEDSEVSSYFRTGTEKNSSPTEIPKLEEDPKPIESQKPEDIQEPAKIQRYIKIQIPAAIQGQEEIKKFIETLAQAQNSRSVDNTEKTGPVTFNDANLFTPQDQEAENNQGISQEQTPVLTGKQEKISDSIAEQKDLVNSERAIRIKLQKIKKSGSHDVETYITELENLKQNLGKQNLLAEKLASEILSKKPQGLVKEEIDLKRRRPEGDVRGPASSLFVTPRPYPVSWGTPTPLPVIQLEKTDLEQPASDEEEETVIIPRNRNTYNKGNPQYLVQKAVPANFKQERTLAFTTTNQPQNLFVVTPSWER